MLLSSVLITSAEGDEAPDLPPIIAENIESLKRNHPGLPHRLFTNVDVIVLLEEKFPKAVLDAYSALQPYAYKADLARYCILYEYGGLYADLAYFIADAIPMPKHRPVVFRGNLKSAPWDTSNGLIYAPPKHKALARAIELVCANVQRRYYGLNELCPTGPALFGKAVASTCEAEEIITGTAWLVARGDAMRLDPNLPFPDGKRIHCQLVNGKLVAVKRKRLASQGLVDLGVTTGNLYKEFWTNKAVYA